MDINMDDEMVAMEEVEAIMVDESKPDSMTLQVLQDLANRLRIQSIQATCALSYGHPTSCSSAAEILSVLFFHVMKYKRSDPESPYNDRFILSKRLSLLDMVTKWLGQGLGAACGMAYTGKYFDKASYRVYCLLGDMESAEGSVWEALAFGSYYNLDNLVAIFDVNHLSHSTGISLELCINTYQKRCENFGWNTYVVDGREVEALCEVFWQAAQVKNKPTAVVAKTFKGRGTSSIDAESWHGKPMPKERADAIIKVIESQIQTNRRLEPKAPIEDSPEVNISDVEMTSHPLYTVGQKVSTRKACGLALAKLGHINDRVVVLDGDSKNSTFSELFRNEHQERFIDCSIAEQNMVSVALGCATRGRTIAFACSFSAFMTRAFDQVRTGAICNSDVNIVGSHCGVSGGEDGPSQMALEDLAIFRNIPNSTIFYPSDAVSTEYAVFLAAITKGICYIRTSRPDMDVIYNPQENFKVGQAKVVRHSKEDKVTVIGAGVTLHEALAAADILHKKGIFIRVIDLFTVKPLDTMSVVTNARATSGRVITVEDHHFEGGIGEAVSSAICMEPDIIIHQMAVFGVPQSRRESELLDKYGISAKYIVKAVEHLLKLQ